MDLYREFGALAELVAGVAFDQQGFASGGATAAAADRDLAAWALQGTDVTLAWIKDRDSLWFADGEATPVTGAALTIEGLADGAWRVRWFDPYGEQPPIEDGGIASGAAVTLAVPAFTRDLALRLDRE
jgi:hypothetical protein